MLLSCRALAQLPATTRDSLPPIIFEGTRAEKKDPFTVTNLSTQDIKPLNNGQDIPYILRFTPSLVSTSDAGNGIGYTGLWIRGSDPARINININGIPLNDPESQQVFWVNTSDFASSLTRVQIQRGIGTSSNGAGAFGGSIKLDTRAANKNPFLSAQWGQGSFGTLRANAMFGTGQSKKGYYLQGRISSIESDGYIDRASTNLKSYFLEMGRFTEKTSIRFISFGGREITYQSWNGTPACVLENNTDSMLAFAGRNYLTSGQTNNLLRSGRTYNFYEYPNQVDHYTQQHEQLHVTQLINKQLRLNVSLHHTKGLGYFEEFKESQDLSAYGLQNEIQNHLIATGDSITTSNLVRRRWLNNDFVGVVWNVERKNNDSDRFEWTSTLAGASNIYFGNHFGKVISVADFNELDHDHEYYRGESRKEDHNIYWKNRVELNKNWSAYTDIQWRFVDYQTAGTDNDLRAYSIHQTYQFFNPKAGIHFEQNQHAAFISLARSSKEPNRNDLVDAIDPMTVKAESMVDLETQYQYQRQNGCLRVTGYAMEYRNQLVLTGQLNDVGAPLRANVDRSYRRGIEFEWIQNIRENWIWSMNATWSENRIRNFQETIYDYTEEAPEFGVTIQHQNTPISFSPNLITGAQLGYKTTLSFSEHHNMDLEMVCMSKFVGKQYLDNTGNDFLTIPTYHVMDLRATATFHPKQDLEIAINVWVNNALDAKYSSNGYTYSYIYETRISERFYYPQAGRNFLFGMQVSY
ncbi:MAG: TonB-dependent receptor [Flavobacteriales bacterium]